MMFGILSSYILIGFFAVNQLFIKKNSKFIFLPSHMLFFIIYCSGLVNFILFINTDLILGNFSDAITSRHISTFLIEDNIDQSLFYEIHIFNVIFLFVLLIFFFSNIYTSKLYFNFTNLNIKISEIYDRNKRIKIFLTFLFFLLLSPVKLIFSFFYDASFLALSLICIEWIGRVETKINFNFKVTISIFLLLVITVLYPSLISIFNEGYSLEIPRGSFVKYIIIILLFSSLNQLSNFKVDPTKLIKYLIFVFIIVFFLDVIQDLSAFSEHSLFEKLFRILYIFEHTIFRNAVVVLNNVKDSNTYLYGETYLNAIHGLIPFTGVERGLSKSIVLLYENLLEESFKGKGFASGYVSEGILNFGIYFGAIFTAVIISTLLFFTDYIFSIYKRSFLHSLTAIYLTSLLYLLFRYDTAVILRKIEYGLILLLLLVIAYSIIGFISSKLSSRHNVKH